MPRDHVRLFHVHPTLKLLKSCRFSLDQLDYLTVEHERALGLCAEILERGYDFRELLRLVFSVARHELHVRWRREREDADAVILPLERPALPRNLATDAR